MSAARPRQITGWHTLAMFTAFFAVIICADIVFAVLAYRSAPGQAANDPYEAGLLYQKHLDAKAREAELGWRATVDRRDGAIELAVLDRGGAPVTGLDVKATFNRPATERGEQTAQLTEQAPGVYRLEARPWTGAWDMRAVARKPDGRVMEIESRLQWP
jgi:nitrogen fixation protein FixH